MLDTNHDFREVLGTAVKPGAHTHGIHHDRTVDHRMNRDE